MAGPIDDTKRALRADIRERRQQRSEPARHEAAAGVQRNLDALVARLGARSMSCYRSTPTEPSTRPFLHDALARGLRVLLPISRTDGLLDWVAGDNENDVVEGLLGIEEQTGERLSPLAVDKVDLLIIPAAAVDRSGMRLGWGRGYYDKTLGSMQTRPPVYAVVFDTELVDELPHDLHDQPVTGVVTPTRIVELASTY
ncbi:5-formyltetrahydrofolate cyclo-ligase [Microbacterium sp.]|uniref:5-formyltetrahydrofolate cyclo-ligase n=1 Tax=Microbacterium sp. TaxID=51671 RepID=UPI003A86632F